MLQLKNGVRAPKSERSPPIAGPITNPIPKAAPIIPKFCARLSGVEISAMYAEAEVKLAPKIPETARPITNHHKSGAKYMTI